LRFLTPCTFCTITQISSSGPGSAESQHVRIDRYVRHPRPHIFLRALVLLLDLGVSYASTGRYRNPSGHTGCHHHPRHRPCKHMVSCGLDDGQYCLTGVNISYISERELYSRSGFSQLRHLNLPASPQSHRLTHATWR